MVHPIRDFVLFVVLSSAIVPNRCRAGRRLPPTGENSLPWSISALVFRVGKQAG